MSVLELSGLTKIYRSGRGISDINITVKEGEIFGLLGTDGAGKTTTLRAALGLIRPKKGSVTFMDKVQRHLGNSFLRNIGYVPGNFDYHEGFSGRGFLKFAAIGRVVDADYRNRIAELFGLTRDDLNDGAFEYPPSMKQALAIVAALQHKPLLLVLDEPTANLEPFRRFAFYDLLEEHIQNGGAVLLASQDMAETERLCRRVAVLQDGRIISEETADTLRERAVYNVLVDMDPPPGIELLKNIDVEDTRKAGKAMHFQVKGNIDHLLRKLINAGNIKDIEVKRGHLEQSLSVNSNGKGDENA